MKRNVYVDVYHIPQSTYIGSGYLFAEPSDMSQEQLTSFLNDIHNSGLRENGISMWSAQKELITFGQRVVAESRITFKIIESE